MHVLKSKIDAIYRHKYAFKLVYNIADSDKHINC